jgi:hypothetical protein
MSGWIERARQIAAEDSRLDGWMFKTSVSKSTIADGAGDGRYAEEDMPSMSVSLVKKIVPMSDISSLSLRSINPDPSISFSALKDLERFVALANEESNLEVAEIHHLFKNFMFGTDGERSILNVSTFTINHSDTGLCNVVVDCDGQKCRCTTSKAIAKGGELTCDYRLFKLPAFYLEYCNRHGFPDVRTFVLNEIGAER